MKTDKDIKKIVKNKYAEIAVVSDIKQSSCCSSSSCCGDEAVFKDDYSNVQGYNPDADLDLGCGIPTGVIEIKEGQTVVDLGSGAGNDVFVARSFVGDTGKVIGIDFTNEMIDKANRNKAKLGYTNIEFKLGEIEKMPLEDNTTDIVLSNCVLNLVPNKQNAFNEIFRILKPGAKFSISDIVLKGEMPDKLKEVAELYAGCVSGAMQEEDYLDVIKKAGFQNINVAKEKIITIPKSELQRYLKEDEINVLENVDFVTKSITVTAEKP